VNLKSMWKKVIVAYFKVLTEVIEEKHKNPQSGYLDS
jgi:hypothetical protein